MYGLHIMVTLGSTSVENILFQLETPILITLLLIITRIILVRFLGALMSRGRISAPTKATLSRLIDLIVVFTTIVVFLEVVVSMEVLVLTVAVIIIIIFLLFYYELREFLAYINLQLQRHLHGRSYEFLLPNHPQPVYGRIISIEPLSSIIEDIYGRRIFVSNTLLVNGIIREYIPAVELRLTLHHRASSPEEVISDIASSIRELKLGIFRIDDKKIFVEKYGAQEAIVRIRAHPTSLPIRISDLAKIVESINKSLEKYDPIIEFTRIFH
jgi:hypothetical protein